MTTATIKYNNPAPIVFILSLLFITFGLFFYGVSLIEPQKYVLSLETLSVSEMRIIEVISGHAWSQHGAEVNAAFNCMGKNGTTKSFKTTGFINSNGKSIPTNLWMCYDGKDWYSIVTTVFERVGNDKIARLVTAYKIAKDLFPTIDDYIAYIVQKWGAFEIKYIIEAGEIFLNPR